MAEFTLPLTEEGAVSLPTGVFSMAPIVVSSPKYLDVGPATVLEIPEFGWAIADGLNPLRFVTKGVPYTAGGIAPNVSMTLAGTGARATSVHTFTAATNPQNNDVYNILVYGIGGIGIIFKSTLSTSKPGGGYTWEVKIGASLSATIANIAALFNNTGTDGTEFFGYSLTVTPADIASVLKLQVSATTGTTVTYRSTIYGTIYNNNVSSEVVDGGASWSLSSWSGGVDNTGSSPSSGRRRYFFTWYRDADGAETGRSPISEFDNSGAGSIAVSGLTASADTTFDYIRIYRTTDLGVEFFLDKTLPSASSSYTDTLDDETLALSPVVWNELLYRAYAEGMPPRGLALAYWKNRLWSLGALLCADYTRGTVSVTEGSAAITFSVKGVTEFMRNRTFQVSATSEQYTLISIDESAGTAVIDRPYEGSTNGTASFKIVDDYDASRIRASVPGLFNQWPVDESPGSVDTDDPDGGRALLATQSRLFAFSKTSIVSVTGDGVESWEVNKVADGVGCVAPRLLAPIEGGALFLARSGFYAISPDETLTCVSEPRAKNGQIAQGLTGTLARISWSNVAQGYSYYDPTERVVVFGLPLDEAVTPNYEIVFDLQNSTWTMFKRPEFTDSATMDMAGGGRIIVAGDRDGCLWHVDVGESDGFYGTEAVQTLSGAQTVRALTVSGTPFSTSGDGEKGKPVFILYADGSTVARGKVATNTTSVLTLAEDLDTAPAAGDQIVIGGIAWHAQSGFTTFGEEYRGKSVQSVTVRHAPATRGDYHFSFATNNGSFRKTPVGTSIGSMAESDGKIRHFTQWPGDAHAFKFRGFKPGGRAVLRGGVFELVVREMGRR